MNTFYISLLNKSESLGNWPPVPSMTLMLERIWERSQVFLVEKIFVSSVVLHLSHLQGDKWIPPACLINDFVLTDEVSGRGSLLCWKIRQTLDRSEHTQRRGLSLATPAAWPYATSLVLKCNSSYEEFIAVAYFSSLSWPSRIYLAFLHSSVLHNVSQTTQKAYRIYHHQKLAWPSLPGLGNLVCV